MKKNYWIAGAALLVLFLFLARTDLAGGNILCSARAHARPVAEQGLTRASSRTKSFLVTVREMFSLGSENEKLRSENALLKSEIQELKYYRYENIELKGLLNLKTHTYPDAIAASVTGRDSANWFYRMEVDKGSAEGVKKNMIVMSPEGVVGQITTVYTHTAVVRTILHKRSAVPAYVVEAGAFGILYGEGGEYGFLKYAYNSSLIETGQLVITSGLGDIYPRGLLIGMIEEGDKSSETYVMRPFVDMEKIDRVLLMEGKREK